MKLKSESLFEEAPPKPSLKTIFFFTLSMAILIICLAAWEFPYLVLPSPYLSFMRKDASYYSQIAHACDSLLRQHLVTSSNLVTLYEGMTLPSTLRLAGNNRSVPKIIKALHPAAILISSNSVVIDIPPAKMGGFGVIWRQDDLKTNQWILQSNGDGLVNTVYQESKP